MIKVVEKSKYSDIKESVRFDSRFYFLGEVLNKTLSRFDIKPLSSFSKEIRKGIFDLNSRYYRSSGIPFIRISNLMSYTLDEKGMVYIPIANHQKEIKTKLVPGDLALSKIGKYLGKIAQVPLRFAEVNTSQNIIGVSFNCEEYLKKYVFLYLTTPLAINQILRVSKQHNQNKLTLPDIRNLSIPLLAEDKMKYYAGVVSELSELENDSYKELRRAKDLLKAKLDIDFKSVKKEFSFNSKLSEIRGESFFSPEYSNPLYNNTLSLLEKFKMKPLSALVDDYKGAEVGSENYSLYVDKLDTDIPFIRTSDIVNHEIDNYPDFYISNEIYTELNQGLSEGDIIFSKDGSIGNCAMITQNDKVIISSGYSILRIKEGVKINPYYIFCALSIPEIGDYQSKKRTVVAATIPHLRPANLLKVLIPIVKEADMNEIAEIVKSAFDKKSIRKQKLEAIKIELEEEFEDK